MYLGRHAIAEIYNCEYDKLNNKEFIEEVMIQSLRKSGATIEKIVFKEFQPQGVSGVIIISESHVTIHTWPEYGYAAVDAFTCGQTVSPFKICEYISDMLGGQCNFIDEIKRGFINKDTKELKGELGSVI